MAGLLDFLTPRASNSIGGGLLDYLNSPLYRGPILGERDPTAEFVRALGQDPFGGAMLAPPQRSIWEQPGAPTYAIPPTPTVFDSGTGPVGGFSQNAPVPPSPPPPQPSPFNVGAPPLQGSSMPQPISPPVQQSTPAPAPQAAPQPDTTQLPPAFGGGGIAQYLQRLHNGGGLITSAFDSPEQQNMQAEYKATRDALIGGGTPVDQASRIAMVSVMNKDVGKALLPEALGQRKFGFIKDDNGNIIRTEPSSGQASLAYGGGAQVAPIQMPDGTLAAPPTGLAGQSLKTWQEQMARTAADAQAGKLTGEQAKSSMFATTMQATNPLIDNTGTELFGSAMSKLPLGNYAQSAKYQKFQQAASAFVTAKLRSESGANIRPDEYKTAYNELIPQPGDQPAALAEKARRRALAVETMRKAAGPGYKAPATPALPDGWSVTVR